MAKQQRNLPLVIDFDQYDLLAKLKEKFSEETILKSGNFLKNEKGIYPFIEKD